MTTQSLRTNYLFMQEQKRRNIINAIAELFYFFIVLLIGIIMTAGVLSCLFLYYGVFK